jgi:hypothetical protein
VRQSEVILNAVHAQPQFALLRKRHGLLAQIGDLATYLPKVVGRLLLEVVEFLMNLVEVLVDLFKPTFRISDKSPQ